MASGEERNLAEVRASLKTKLMILTRKTLNNNKNQVKVEEGQIIIKRPKEDIKAKIRTVIFRCKNVIIVDRQKIQH